MLIATDEQEEEKTAKITGAEDFFRKTEGPALLENTEKKTEIESEGTDLPRIKRKKMKGV